MKRPNRVAYDIDASWEDPTKKMSDSRIAKRCSESFRIKIGVETPDDSRPLVGPGVVQNISTNGLCCLTKHRLKNGQKTMLFIPTEDFPNDRDLPSSFFGEAEVIRIDLRDNEPSKVALEFTGTLTGDMAFIQFIDHLHGLSSMKSSES
jgi:hypothetical protein